MAKQLSKDDAILLENVGATPDELLRKGLSQKRYLEMLGSGHAQQPKQKVNAEALRTEHTDTDNKSPQDNKIAPVVNKSEQQTKPMPKLIKAENIYNVSNDQIGILCPNGRVELFSIEAANKLVSKYPEQYKIV